MKKITDKDTLQAAVNEFYETIRAAMIEHQKKPFNARRLLDRTWALAARAARVNGIVVENLPIPKSIVQSAPVITTLEAKKKKATVPPDPTGDLLADNAPKTKRRGRPRKTKR